MSRPRSGNAGLLPVVLVSLALVVAAVPALNVALPSIAADTGATLSQLQWIVDAYALVFAGLLMPAGAIGDRYGRKTVLVGGLAVFTAASAAAAITTTPEALITLRAVMGLGAAFVMPTTLSIITTSYPEERRGAAVGAWVGVAGAGAVVGLLVSGSLLEFWSWPAVFAVNAAVGAVVVLAAAYLVPDSWDSAPPRVDYLGGLLSVVALTGIVFGAIEGPERGWSDPVTLTAFAAGAGAAVLWIGWSLRIAEPLLDPRLFRDRSFTTGVLSISLQFFVFFGYVFVILQYLQLVLDYSPLQAGLALTPMALALGPLSRIVPHLQERVGRRPLAVTGLALLAAGMLVLASLDADSSYWHLLAGIVPIGAGMALAALPATTDIVASMPAHKQGVASAVNDAAREVGGTLGIAVLGSVLNDRYRSGVEAAAPAEAPGRVVEIAQESLAAALQLAARLGERGRQLADGARDAFVDGMSDAFLAAGVGMAVLAVVFVVAIPGRRSRDDDAPGTGAGDARANGAEPEPVTNAAPPT